MPGVLMLEALAQAAALLSFDAMGASPTTSTVFYFAGIDGARFKRPVEPGDQLMLDVTLDAHEGGHLQVQGARASVGGELAGRGRADVHDAQGRLSAARMATIHPTAIVEPGAELDAGGRRRRLQHRRRRTCASAPARRVGPHCVIEGRTTIGRDNRIFQFCSLGARAAGQEVRRRADRAGDRRPQHDPRVLHLQPRHRAGRRRHPPRRRQLDHGLRAHRARLPGRQPHHPRQQRRRWPATCTSATG